MTFIIMFWVVLFFYFQESVKVKVQRGRKSKKSQVAEGQRIYYNFVKPHQALKGQTPAVAAGVKLEGKNKWRILIQNAIYRESNKVTEPGLDSLL